MLSKLTVYFLPPNEHRRSEQRSFVGKYSFCSHPCFLVCAHGSKHELQDK